VVGSLLSLEARVGIAFAGWTFPFNSNLNTRAAVCALFTDGLKNIPRIKALGTNPTTILRSEARTRPSLPSKSVLARAQAATWACAPRGSRPCSAQWIRNRRPDRLFSTSRQRYLVQNVVDDPRERDPQLAAPQRNQPGTKGS